MRSFSRFLVFLAAALAIAASAASDQGAGAPRLEDEVLFLKEQLALARSGGFYLVLDPQAGRLRLMYSGALLQEFPVRGLEVGIPRRFFVRGGPSGEWWRRTWDGGELSPVRPRAVSPPDGVDLDSWVPPTPDEAFPLPDLFHVRYADGLALEVVPAPPPPATLGDRARGVARRAGDAARLLLGLSADAVRIRIHLDAADAAALHRGFPEASSLVIGAIPGA